MAQGSLVAGARVWVRDAEWVVGHVERNSLSGAIIHAIGLSGIIRGRPAIFVESLERQRGRGIVVVDPADVRLVPDSSGGYEDTLLHLEAAFRKSAPTGPTRRSPERPPSTTSTSNSIRSASHFRHRGCASSSAMTSA